MAATHESGQGATQAQLAGPVGCWMNDFELGAS